MAYNEVDLSREHNLLYETLSKKVVDRLRKNNFNSDYARDSEEALAKVRAAISGEATIGIGDSMTLHQIGLYRWLGGETNRVIFNPFEKDRKGYSVNGPEETFEIMRKALTADVFLTSSNAVTLDGKLVNMDGIGNRVAGMIFGPRKTILVIGANKIVKDVDEAIKRIRNYCSPMNVKRHFLKHHLDNCGKLPCIAAGICIECKDPMRICRKLVIIDGQVPLPAEGNAHVSLQETYVIMVGESLGI